MKYKYKQSFKKSCGTTFNFLSHNSDFPLESLFLLGFFFFLLFCFFFQIDFSWVLIILFNK